MGSGGLELERAHLFVAFGRRAQGAALELVVKGVESLLGAHALELFLVHVGGFDELVPYGALVQRKSVDGHALVDENGIACDVADEERRQGFRRKDAFVAFEGRFEVVKACQLSGEKEHLFLVRNGDGLFEHCLGLGFALGDDERPAVAVTARYAERAFERRLPLEFVVVDVVDRCSHGSSLV